MSKTVIRLNEQGKFPLSSVSGFVDILKVKYYSIKNNKDGTLTLKLYDKNRKLVKPNVK